MMILDKWRKNKHRVLDMGRVAREEARKAGVPSYYMDPSVGDGIVRAMPDGTRELIGSIADEEVGKGGIQS